VSVTSSDATPPQGAGLNCPKGHRPESQPGECSAATGPSDSTAPSQHDQERARRSSRDGPSGIDEADVAAGLRKLPSSSPVSLRATPNRASNREHRPGDGKKIVNALPSAERLAGLARLHVMQSLVPDIGVVLTNFAAQVSCRRLPHFGWLWSPVVSARRYFGPRTPDPVGRARHSTGIQVNTDTMCD
jgi:hypothetical protein